MPKPVEVTTPSSREIVVTRAFDAPRALLWDCHTKADLVRRWVLGPGGWTMPVCVIDLRVGGRYRYVWRNEKDGRQFGAFGRHREIAAPERLVTTEEMDGLDGRPMNIDAPVEGDAPALNTLTLTEEGGRTTLRLVMLFATEEIRDRALRSGMTDGMGQSYDKLDAILAERKAA